MDKKLLSSSEFYKRRYQNFATLLIIPITLLALFIVLFSLYATKEIVVTTTGQITPSSKIVLLQSPSDNTITTNKLRDNQTVKKGDMLLKYAKKQVDKDGQLLLTPTGKPYETTTPQSLTAPSDGILHLEKDYSQQKNITTGTIIGEIYPNINNEKSVTITYYVNSNQITSIKTGQTARMILKNDKNQNVAITGKVNSIDTKATNTKEGNLFKISAQATIRNKTIRKLLKYGLQGQVSSIIAKQTYFDYYKDKLFTPKN